MATTFAIQALGLVSGALVARVLGVHGRGLLATVILVPNLLAYLGDLGGPVAYAYLVASRPDRANALARNAVSLALGQSIVLAAIGVPIVLLALRNDPAMKATGILFLFGFLPLNLLTRYLNAINQGLDDFRRFNMVRVAVQATYVLGIILMFLFNVTSVLVAVWVVLISNLVTLAVAITGMGYRTLAVKVNRTILEKTFSYGLRAHIGNLAPIDSLQLDLAVVVFLLGATDAGIYAVAASGAMIIRAQGAAIGMVALQDVASSDDEGRRRAAGRIFRLSILFESGVALAIVVAAGWLVPFIYGSAFGEAVLITRVLALGAVAAALRQVLGDCLRGFGQPMQATFGELAGWIVAIVGFWTLVPRYATLGVAITVSASYFAALLVCISYLGRQSLSFTELFRLDSNDLRLALSVSRNVVAIFRR
jgi:O-antigen/teichoic acid export membrane protein